MIERKDIFIDGAWIPSTASGVLTVTNAATEENAPMKRRTFLKAMGLTLALPATRVLAQGGRNIRMIVPLPAGSSNDSATRVISAALSPLLGQVDRRGQQGGRGRTDRHDGRRAGEPGRVDA